MSYAEFLLQWYNLPFDAAVVIAAGLAVFGHRIGGSSLGWPLFILGVTGLTLNGAIHDLALGSPASSFPVVLALALVSSAGLTHLGRRIRSKMFPQVTGVTWNQPGLDGSQAQVVSPTGGPDSPKGRARVRDEYGVSHVVRIHSDGAALRFGKRIRLGAFDESTESYPADPV